MDEVHYLADRFRGAVWEEVIIGLADSVQVVSLSATVSNAEEFGDWLSEVRGAMAVVVSEARPVPLFQHVMAGRRLYDLFTSPPSVNPELIRLAREESRFVRDDRRRPRNSRTRDAIAERNRGAPQLRLVPRRDSAVERLDAEDLLPAIYFIFSRSGCDQAVDQIVDSGLRLTTAEERRQIDGIIEDCRSRLDAADMDALGFNRFAAALRRGIAAHHAGMLPAFKESVEEAFVRGLVKIVFATETLALGINMPARSVVLEKLSKFNGEAHVDITPGEFTQLTGRAGRRGIDIEGHAIVLWQRGMDPRSVAGLASRRTYPLRSSFAPTYNMAVNLVATVGRARARVLLEQSFAQFQSDRSVVGLARSIARNNAEIEKLWEQASCDVGDFEEYALMRDQIRRLEAEVARVRRSDRQAETMSVLLDLKPGDIIGVPSGRHQGWAVVVDTGTHRRTSGDSAPSPMVLTEERQIRRLSIGDFPSPPPVVGRMRIPKHFDPREARDRRSLAAAFLSRLAGLDVEIERYRPAAVDAEVSAELAILRSQMRQHPCHGCPDRESHARLAEQALRLTRENEGLRRQSKRRSNTIATRFDRICSVLESLGYLSEGGETVTEAGHMLARIYSELDLVAAEALRSGVFDELSAPELAAVASTLVYESRGGETRRPPAMPNSSTDIAMTMVRRIWREVSLLERDQRLEHGPQPDLGFAQAAFAWASGAGLGDVLYTSEMTAGDFVRWARMLVTSPDSWRTPPAPEEGHVPQLIHRVRRSVVDVAYEDA